MPRVHHVKRAQKDYPEAGIAKGESYYWWKFRYGGKHKSKTYPKRSQLTQSEFLANIYDVEDQISNVEDIDTAREILDQLDEIRTEVEERMENMPEQFQGTSSSYELLEERRDSLEEMYEELENAIDDWDMIVDSEDEDEINERIEEFKNVSYAGA